MCVLALVALLSGCDGPAAPELPPMRDLSGKWSGTAIIGGGLPTPLKMTLVDVNGTLTGSGGEVDCRYFVNCGSFYTYTVTGTHDRERITLNGVPPNDRIWTMVGTISRDGRVLSGTVTGKEVDLSPWSMVPVPAPVGVTVR